MAGRLGILEHERAGVEEIVRRGLEGVVPVTPKGSKVVRARAVIPLLEAGNVHVTARASWLPGYLEEAAQFPNGEHDDQVDAFSQAVSRLSARGKPATATSPASRRLPTHVA
jgi:predicted phage terminase large subunit-like protein